MQSAFWFCYQASLALEAQQLDWARAAEMD